MSVSAGACHSHGQLPQPLDDAGHALVREVVPRGMRQDGHHLAGIEVDIDGHQVIQKYHSKKKRSLIIHHASFFYMALLKVAKIDGSDYASSLRYISLVFCLHHLQLLRLKL